MREYIVDLNAVKARLGSIPADLRFCRKSLEQLVRHDLPSMVAELEEYRASLRAKAETVKLGEPRGVHAP